MTQDMNESAQLNQELKQIIGKFKEYFGILDDLAEVQRQFEESARQLTERQDKTEEIL